MKDLPRVILVAKNKKAPLEKRGRHFQTYGLEMNGPDL
jgi:hypothetical protein